MSSPTAHGSEPETAADATLLEVEAALRRAEMEASPVPASRDLLRLQAEELEARATRLRDLAANGVPDLQVGNGGEVSPLPDATMPRNMLEVARTVQARPGLVAAEASMDRLTLARDAGVLTLAVDAAETTGAQGAVQQTLVHEMVAGHSLAMRLLASAQGDLQAHERDRLTGEGGRTLADATRTATAAARLMDSVSRVALALNRLKNGGRQHVTVQYVAVADGGQAVVAARLEPGGGAPSRRRRGGGA